jgi:hypothetical protein
VAAGDLITQDGQAEWRGLLLGAGTRYRLTDLEGWLDLDETRDGDVDLDNEHGAQPGQLLAARRVVTWSGHIAGRAGFADAVLRLRSACTLDENPVEEPLVIQTAGVKHLAYARCVRRKIPQNMEWVSSLTRFVVQWRATNPRVLRLPMLTPQATPPVSGGNGLRFPLRFPLMFGSTPAGGVLVLPNDGGAHAQPVWRITGPCPGPRITNADTGARLWFDGDYTVPAGQYVDLSIQDKSVLLYASASSRGVSRSNRLAVREWFTLPPGTTRVRFDSVDGTGTLTCRYHHTDM